MYYIGTQIEAEEYNNIVTQGEGYSGTTIRWADVLQHPTNGTFAIIKHESYTHESMQLVESLTEDWYDIDNA